MGISEVGAFVPNYCLVPSPLSDLMPVMDAQVYFSIVKENYNLIHFPDCYMHNSALHEPQFYVYMKFL